MVHLLMAFAATAAIQAAPVTTARTLQNIPGAKIHYYDVSGDTGSAIGESLSDVIKAQPKTVGQLYTWTVTANVQNATEGTVCKVASATALLDANVYLPRPTQLARLSSDDLQRWKSYETGQENAAADNLWFVVDRLPAIQQSLAGLPCDQAGTLWNSSVKTLMDQQQAFDRKRSKSNPMGSASSRPFGW